MTPLSVFNKQFKFNFNGSELSSDGGLFLLKEFAHRIGFEKIIRDNFQTNDSAVSGSTATSTVIFIRKVFSTISSNRKQKLID